MQTDLDMNGYKVNSPFVVTGFYNKTKNKSHVFLNGGIPFQIIPFDCHLIGISSHIHPSSRLGFRYTLQMKNSGSLGITKDATQNVSKNHIVLNERLEKEDVVSFDIFRLNLQDGPAFSQACFSLSFLNKKMKRRETIFNFNHINNERPAEEIEELKEFYEYYHKLAWCYKKSFKREISRSCD